MARVGFLGPCLGTSSQSTPCPPSARCQVRWHYVLIDVLCEYVRGDPFPATDAANARFIPLRELGEYEVAPTALEVLRTASAARIAFGETFGP